MTENLHPRDFAALETEAPETASNPSVSRNSLEALHAISLIDTTDSAQPSQPAFPTPQATSPPLHDQASRPQVTSPSREEQAPINPQLSALHAMFPDYDDAIL